ncbi:MULTISPECIES: dethiobiotin synthase [Edwardsiella]|uniref:ATP-dependent dethiobiotin synthetase BioD n=2 Tax=Edwardsiella anguillarum TaxID=1821960 RepID=A0A076LQC3_9GAMM|nr:MULTISPECIES: dethiobiotin synthase [Edwardsiella]AIJ10176.1 Dethiobiotin synthetase [Edwardsiella anguillarum ET080813]AKR77747.1 dethiobiotin synthase [Edwardsiella sp. LADL05-105]KAB0592146.1 ATP-dependent dethiobiotin synthetase BioD [Edwardsiella anguillarum]UOU77414.1 dethiobiotin synthase [Edwardsiella anguillarum]WHP85608.1 dethiobiotin synthase [Edwardsiella anguillarum]
MLKRVFVTGTDTEVGKTVASRALLQAIQAAGHSAVGYKPIAVGSDETPQGLRNRDAVTLLEASSMALSYDEVNPVTLREEIANAYTGEALDYGAMSRGLQHLSVKAQHVVVQGTGGWRVLMQDLRPLSEWVVQEQLPVILVVGIKLGCISHAILTAQAIINDGLPFVGWIANRINPGLSHYAETIDALRQKLPAPQLGEIPYLYRPEEKALARYIDLSALV